MASWKQRCTSWRDGLFGHSDLVTQLLAFQDARRGAKEAKI
jgi:hypothetical protein